jgi:hypothetical protein
MSLVMIMPDFESADAASSRPAMRSATVPGQNLYPDVLRPQPARAHPAAAR